MEETSDQALLKLAAKYTQVPNNLAIFVGPGFTMAAPSQAPGCQNTMAATLQAGLAAGGVPASLNPSGQLYSRGLMGLTLESPFSSSCDPGCFYTHPDPRNAIVKPLYTGYSYKLPESSMPTANTARGMYP